MDAIINGELQLVMNTTIGRQSILDSHSIRHETVRASIPYFTTIEACLVATEAMARRSPGQKPQVASLQSYHRQAAEAP